MLSGACLLACVGLLSHAPGWFGSLLAGIVHVSPIAWILDCLGAGLWGCVVISAMDVHMDMDMIMDMYMDMVMLMHAEHVST